MAMVFQSAALFNSLSVGENVGLWLKEHRVCGAAEIARIVAEKLALVGLAGTERARPAELSGGMKKRVSIARALAVNPHLILYDEPTAGLDPVLTEQIGTVISDLKRLRITAIVVTHDLNLAAAVADRMGMIHEGRLIEVGTPAQIWATAESGRAGVPQHADEGPGPLGPRKEGSYRWRCREKCGSGCSWSSPS